MPNRNHFILTAAGACLLRLSVLLLVPANAVPLIKIEQIMLWSHRRTQLVLNDGIPPVLKFIIRSGISSQNSLLARSCIK